MTHPDPSADRYVQAVAQPFGMWLLAQTERGGLIGQLVDAAKLDRQFPGRGDPEAVRGRLRAMQADGDMFDAVDDAEADWRALQRG